jgi:YD repeat-containing protein
MTDREKAGLRGPVKICVEEGQYHTGGYVTTTEFTADGRLLSTRHINPDGSEWVTTQTYDPAGRLAKTTFGKSGEPGEETLQSYDEVGRLLSITHSTKTGDRTEYQYDAQGRKTAIQTFAPETLQRFEDGHVAVHGSFWDAAVRSGIGVPVGGRITTIYNEKDQPTEAQILDAKGQVVTHFVRTYDAGGRISEEKSICGNAARGFADQFANRLVESVPSELRDRVTSEEVDRVSELISKIASALFGDEPIQVMSYTYDTQGRITTTRQRHMGLESSTVSAYNDHGEKAEEQHNFTANPAFQSEARARLEKIGITPPKTPESPQPAHGLPELQVTRFAYQYDSYGNWTQQAISSPSCPDQPPTVLSRKLTYY